MKNSPVVPAATLLALASANRRAWSAATSAGRNSSGRRLVTASTSMPAEARSSPLRDLIGGDVQWVPAVAHLRHPAQRGVALAPAQNGQARPLGGLGVHPERRQAVEFPLEPDRFTPPACLDDPDRLPHTAPAVVKRLPQEVELLLEPPGPHPKQHPAPGEVIDGPHRLGDRQGLA